MEFNIKTMKMRANALIKATKPNPAIATLILMAFAYAISIILFTMMMLDSVNVVLSVILIILSLLKIFVDIGYSWYTLGISREEDPSIGVVFQPLTKISIKAFIAVIIKSIIISVFSTFFYVPGIIAFYWFRPLYFIAKDNPEMSVFKMLSTSIKMMKGNKMTWFKLDISFIVWFIINIATFGLFNIYSLQRVSTAYAELYDFIKDQSQN